MKRLLVLAIVSMSVAGSPGLGLAFQKGKSSSNRGNNGPSYTRKGNNPNQAGPGQGQKGMSQAQKEHLAAFMSRNNLSSGQQGALTRLETGDNLTDDDRATLTTMLASDSRLDPETRDIIKQGLQDDLANKRAQEARQNQRYLKIKNDTNQTLTVFLQYRTSQADTWVWLPNDPKKSAESLTLSIPAGQEVYAEVDKNRVLSSRVRLWARSTAPNGQQWLEYKDQDLWLVPEVDRDNPQDKSKEHVYFAPEAQTFTFVFRS
jgi:hypothetical protein